MLRIPRTSHKPLGSIYTPLGLKDLPFPTDGVLKPYSYDPRDNGTIYAEGPVRSNIDQFENLLIRPTDFPNRVRLAYLWASGDPATGRGMGKTALLRYFRQRINQDWGDTEFDGRFSALVVYVSFQDQVDRRYMEQLALSALVDICKNGVLEASRAALRLQYIPDDKARDIIHTDDGTDDLANILNNQLLEANDVDPIQLDSTVSNHLTGGGVRSAAALALSQGRFEDYLKSFRKDNSLEPLYVPRDTKLLDYSRGLLFNDIVIYLRTAGFAGGYLFIDDIENLVDQMTRKHRLEFAKEFALCTVRPGYVSTNYNFFSCVLTTHQSSALPLSSAWAEAGLAGIAHLDPTSPNSVELPVPDAEQSREIIIAHLDYYRLDDGDKGTIKPFSEDGIAALLKDREQPRNLLIKAAQIVRRAAQEGLASIDASFVSAASDGAASQVTPDFTEGIEDAV